MRNSYTVLTTNAYIMHTRGISEADRVITALTHKCGVLKIHARGIRKEKAKMRSVAIPYNQVQLSVVQGKRYILKDIAVTDTLKPIWSNQRTYTAYVNLLRHVHTLIPVIEEKDERLFSIVHTATNFMQESDPRLADHILLTAQVLILNALGYISDPIVSHGTFSRILRTVSADPVAEKRVKRHLNQALYHQ